MNPNEGAVGFGNAFAATMTNDFADANSKLGHWNEV
jgi:hypothetical protein